MPERALLWRDFNMLVYENGEIVEKPDDFTPSQEISLESAKENAVAEISSYADAVVKSFIGNAPLTEQLSWTAKNQAARNYLEGKATEFELEILQTEAFVTGEPINDLVSKIIPD